MSEIFKIIVDFIKLKPRHFFIVAFVSAIMLFSGKKFLELIGVRQLAENYRSWFGLAFLVSIAFCVVSSGDFVYGFVRPRILRRNFKRKVAESLRRLTEHEKQILRFYIANQTKTNLLHREDGVVQGLVTKRIIYQAVNIGSAVDGFAYNIQETAWELLNENPHVLEGSTAICRTDKLDSSPDFKW